ncbi:MAG: class I SAM-dependent methyltransferase [Mycobacterium sp.]
MMWSDRLGELVRLPRGQQLAALQELRSLRVESAQEDWNSTFGADSLYDAWSRLPIMEALYQQNRAVLTEHLGAREGWHIVEIGGGNGALWDGYLSTLGPGTLTLVDPNADAHRTVRAKLPPEVDVQSVVASVETADLPVADVVVCSLTLHHVAGLDAVQRRSFGLDGAGKLEVLQGMVAAVRPRGGIVVLNEADVHNEVDLPPGDPVLVDRFIDAYVRRAARSVAEAIDVAGADTQLRRAWEVILQSWCLDQVELAHAPRVSRDVYELDAARWLELIRQSGAQHQTHRFTDQWNLFQQYVFG